MLWYAVGFSQYITQDWKLHDVGAVIQLVINNGKLNLLGTDYPGLLNTEYPLNSYSEHMGSVGWYIGGITPKGDTLVSVTHSFSSPDEFRGYSAAPWDTIWVVSGETTRDIPYLPEYSPVSDQDFVTRYNDYSKASLQVSNHQPMYLDVLQTSFAWSSPPLDEIIVFNYWVTATQFDLSEVYVANFVDGNVGYRTGSGFAFGQDDYSTYHPGYHMGISHDGPGGPDGGKYTPMGLMFLPGKGINPDNLTWTWMWNSSSSVVPTRDPDRWAQMASGKIMRDQETASGTNYMLSFGPFQLNRGDTLHFKLIEILGMDEEAILDNAEIANWLIEQDFNVPSPPPAPPLSLEAQNRHVNIIWNPTVERNPEDYTDANRADGISQPFEGYRLYKSTESAVGPWTLLGEYDLADNTFGANTGLNHRYTDTGLLNNVEYYYTVTAFSKPDTVSRFPSQESSLLANAKTITPGTAPPASVGEVAVVPNPYRGDVNYNAFNPPWEKPPRTRENWMEQDRRVQFINLPEQCRIRVYTLSGDLITTLQHSDPERGYEDWNLTSAVGQAISSGIYLFTVEDTGPGATRGKLQTGKFIVIK